MSTGVATCGKADLHGFEAHMREHRLARELHIPHMRRWVAEFVAS